MAVKNLSSITVFAVSTFGSIIFMLNLPTLDRDSPQYFFATVAVALNVPAAILSLVDLIKE